MTPLLSPFWTAVILILTGCEQRPNDQNSQVTFQQRIIRHPNPTKYEFDAPTTHVKTAVKNAFNKWEDEELKLRKGRVWNGSGDAETKRRLTLALQTPPGLLLSKGDGDSLAKDIFSRPGNENDAYFYGSDSPVGESSVYFKEGQPLIYYANFHIHLSPIAPDRTRVEIFTYDPSVVTGIEKRWAPHGTSLIAADVPPTTIEEYQILLRIGDQLKVTNMQPAIVPGTNSPVKQISTYRKR